MKNFKDLRPDLQELVIEFLAKQLFTLGSNNTLVPVLDAQVELCPPMTEHEGHTIWYINNTIFSKVRGQFKIAAEQTHKEIMDDFGVSEDSEDNHECPDCHLNMITECKCDDQPNY